MNNYGGSTWPGDSLSRASEMAGHAAQNVFAPRSCTWWNGPADKDYDQLSRWMRFHYHGDKFTGGLERKDGPSMLRASV